MVGGQKERSQGHNASLAVRSVLPAYMKWEGFGCIFVLVQ